MFYIGLYSKNIKKILSEQYGLESLSLVCSITRCTSTKFVQIMPLGLKKWPHPREHIFYIGLYSEKHEKNFLSEIIWPRVLIFGM